MLELLLESARPTKAYDVLHRLKDDGDAKPPTVYRALDFLLEMGLIHRIESLKAFAPCGHWAHGHIPVFLICDGCGSVGEINAYDSFKKLGQETGGVDFKLRTAVIEARGHCENCA